LNARRLIAREHVDGPMGTIVRGGIGGGLTLYPHREGGGHACFMVGCRRLPDFRVGTNSGQGHFTVTHCNCSLRLPLSAHCNSTHRDDLQTALWGQ
jgi:hypothetical protein